MREEDLCYNYVKSISLCIPCMNRTHDLRQTMPSLIAAANASPPVEIVVLDYNSRDDLAEFIQDVRRGRTLTSGNSLAYKTYTGRDHFHMAHARNLSMLSGQGDFLIAMCADISMQPRYISVVREKLDQGYTWLHHSDRFVGVVCVQREEFIASGGYDERFEFYGKEDKDFLYRLMRRGTPHAQIPDMLSLIYTPWPEKLRNYRLPLSRREVSKRAKRIFYENMENGVLVANEGKEWGQWE